MVRLHERPHSSPIFMTKPEKEIFEQLEEKPWLRRRFRDGKLFVISIDYIYEHVGSEQKKRLGLDADAWTLSKEYVIDELLDSGMSPDDIFPIRVALHPLREEFSVTDGITRLRVYKRRGILSIRVKIFHG